MNPFGLYDLRDFFLSKMRLQKSVNGKVVQELRRYGLLIVGAGLISLAYSVFLIPHKIVAGGILGLSMVVHEQISLSIGMIALLINIPLLLLGVALLGKKAGFKTAIFMILISLLLEVFSFLKTSEYIVNDVLLSSIFGGAVIGLSVYLVKSVGATTGGNDILAQMVSKRMKIEFHQFILTFNIIVVLLGAITFGDYTIAAYCLVSIIATSKTIEYFMKQNMKSKTILVFSKQNELIQDVLQEEVDKENGKLKLVHKDGSDKLIVVTKSMRKTDTLEELIYHLDEKAKVVVLDSA